MITNYHNRSSYEALLKRLVKEKNGGNGGTLPADIYSMSDRDLLLRINRELRRLWLVELTPYELNMELH